MLIPDALLLVPAPPLTFFASFDEMVSITSFINSFDTFFFFINVYYKLVKENRSNSSFYFVPNLDTSIFLSEGLKSPSRSVNETETARESGIIFILKC